MQKTSTQAAYQDPHAELIQQGKNGDNEAYRKLYGLYAKAMYNVSVRILNNEGEAEDVLQESFLDAFRNMGQFEGKASFGQWLKRIVINRSLDVLKKRKLNLVPMHEVEEPGEETEEEPESYTLESVQQAIRQLPDGFRTIFTLYALEDYSHKMIAEKLQISESTSKSQYLRARQKLISLIKQQHHGK